MITPEGGPLTLPGGVAIALGISASATILSAPRGMTSETAFVDDRERRSVLKRCRNPIYLECLRRERRVLAALSGSSLPIPRVVGYHEVREGGEVADVWLLMTRLPGEPLWDVLLRSAPVDRPERFRTLGRLLRDVHATLAPVAFRSQAPWIDRALEQARQNLPWCDGSAALLAELRASKPAPHREVLMHGDLALDNVLVEPDGRMSLIDWSGADLGDPRQDVALALSVEPELQLADAEETAFFEGYGGPPPDAATTTWFRRLYQFF